MNKVDVVINAFGKPFQTALSLFSLLKYSGYLIDKIYFIVENKEVILDGKDINNHDALLKFLGEKVVFYKTPTWIGWEPALKSQFCDDDYRLSIRYQYGWEKTDKKFLFITHNDAFYTKDIIGKMLLEIKDNIAIGKVGQCWNCPAHYANKCTPNIYFDYRPSFEELVNLYEYTPFPQNRKKRGYLNLKVRDIFQKQPWPLPECRVNEWAALINMDIARGVTIPNGTALPFGAFGGKYPVLDTGVGWFRDISVMGYKAKNFEEIDDFVYHDAGKPALFDKALYSKKEIEAQKILENDFGIDLLY